MKQTSLQKEGRAEGEEENLNMFTHSQLAKVEKYMPDIKDPQLRVFGRSSLSINLQ